MIGAHLQKRYLYQERIMNDFVFVETTDIDSEVSSPSRYYQISASGSSLHYDKSITTSKGSNIKILKHTGDVVSRALSTTFLPSGYPDSVRSEYLEYQFWGMCKRCIACSSYSISISSTSSTFACQILRLGHLISGGLLIHSFSE